MGRKIFFIAVHPPFEVGARRASAGRPPAKISNIAIYGFIVAHSDRKVKRQTCFLFGSDKKDGGMRAAGAPGQEKTAVQGKDRGQLQKNILKNRGEGLTKNCQTWYNKMLLCPCVKGPLPLLNWSQCNTGFGKRQGTCRGIYQRVRAFGKRPSPRNCRFFTKRRAVFPANGPEKLEIHPFSAEESELIF